MMDNLIKLMKQHDWYFDYSDDQRVFRNGWKSWQNLKEQLALYANELTYTQKLTLLKEAPQNTVDFSIIERIVFGGKNE